MTKCTLHVRYWYKVNYIIRPLYCIEYDKYLNVNTVYIFFRLIFSNVCYAIYFIAEK